MSVSSGIKRILVTGGNKGIGRAVCEKLLNDYDDVHVLLGSRDKERGKMAVQEICAALGDGSSNRLELVEIDTSSTESVSKAAEVVSKGGHLYAILNNAGIGFGLSVAETVETNYFGPRRVNDAFGKLLQKPGGRIVNVASASGPMFVNSCSDAGLRGKLADPVTIAGGIDELDKIAKTTRTGDSYGFSKALLNAYTVLHAKSEPDLIINSVTPGWILTDITKGMGATNAPSVGAKPLVTLLMSEDFEKLPSGRYYGSDSVRSPLFEYRGPGDPPYEGA